MVRRPSLARMQPGKALPGEHGRRAAGLAASLWIPLVPRPAWPPCTHACRCRPGMRCARRRGCGPARGAGALIPVVPRVRGSGLLIAAAYPPEDTNATENAVLRACNGPDQSGFSSTGGTEQPVMAYSFFAMLTPRYRSHDC